MGRGRTRRCRPTEGASALRSSERRRLLCLVHPPCRQPRRLSGHLLAGLALIRDLLIPALLERYPEVETGEHPDPIAVFQTPWPGVGPIEIVDDGWEATIYVGELTHGHVNPYNDELTQGEIDAIVTEDVLDFLSALFNDEVLVWSTVSHNVGGWIWLNRTEPPAELRPDANYYVWSGPYQPSSS